MKQRSIRAYRDKLPSGAGENVEFFQPFQSELEIAIDHSFEREGSSIFE